MQGLHQRRLSDRVTSWLFLLPALAIVVVAVVIPLINSVFLSTQTVRLNMAHLPPRYVGLDNYSQMLRDPDFIVTLGNTAVFAIISVAIECILGLMVAMMLSGDSRGARFLRSLMLVPMIMAPVVSGNLWRMMLDKSTGVINYMLGVVGLPSVNWLGETPIALWSVILVDVWRMLPWVSLLLISGIKAVSLDTIEAGMVDGVSRWGNFRHIILPQLSRIFILVLMIRTIDAFKVFDVVYVMTGGGPGRSTEMLPNYIYTQGLRYFNAGYAAALAISFLAAMSVIATFFMLLRRRVDA